jgi:propanol-preferring alcohol dehydrogenase
MKTMALTRPAAGRVDPQEREVPIALPGELLVKVGACGVCRTDLHLVDGELPQRDLPIVPGHEIVGSVATVGDGATGFAVGDRVGIPWLGYTCGICEYCRAGRENLCVDARFTGYHLDGGYAEYVVADARYTFKVPERYTDVEAAPLLCAGLIGYRAYRMTGLGIRSREAKPQEFWAAPASGASGGAGGDGVDESDAVAAPADERPRLGLYGFGAAAHIIAQVARAQGIDVYGFTSPGDTGAQDFARSLGAVWAGGSNEPPPAPLDAAIIFAPAGALVPEALRRVKPAGTVVCAGIHMSDIPSFPYADLWQERVIRSVANLTRDDAREFLALAATLPIQTRTRAYPLADANAALADLRERRIEGAAVLVP